MMSGPAWEIPLDVPNEVLFICRVTDWPPPSKPHLHYCGGKEEKKLFFFTLYMYIVGIISVGVPVKMYFCVFNPLLLQFS